MYTISAFWSHARENLDITTVVYANRAYDILRIELQRVGAQSGAGPGPDAESLLDLTPPVLDFVMIAEGMGVPARRVSAAEDLAVQFDQTLSGLQDLDYAKAVTDLTFAQVSLQAAQKSFVQVQGLSLFEFI